MTDFGLAAAAPMEDAGERGRGATVFVDGMGMTPEYASPEQYERKPLTRRSGLWSWGLSVLEMFTGELSWQAGPVASMALEGYLDSGTVDASIPNMPPALSDFLKRCFEHDPENRPGSMKEAEAALVEIYQTGVGKPDGRTAV